MSHLEQLIDYIATHQRGSIDSEVIDALRRLQRIEEALLLLKRESYRD